MHVNSCVYKNYSICVFAVDLYAYERTFVDLLDCFNIGFKE
jgi:hypothetical protein